MFVLASSSTYNIAIIVYNNNNKFLLSEMAFRISRSDSALTSERDQKESIDQQHIDIRDNIKDSTTAGGGISSELHLKSPSQTLDKHVVLRRIKQRKSYNKAKNAFEALLGALKTNPNTAQEQKWLQHDDTFSSP